MIIFLAADRESGALDRERLRHLLCAEALGAELGAGFLVVGLA